MANPRRRVIGAAFCLFAASLFLAGCNGAPAVKRVALAPGGGKVDLRFHPPKGDSYLYQSDTVTDAKVTQTETIQTDIVSTVGGETRVEDTIKGITNSDDTEELASRREEKFKGVRIETTCDQFAIVHAIRGIKGGSDVEAERKAEQQINAGLQGVVFPNNPVGEGWHWSADMDWSALLKIIGLDAKLSETPVVTYTLTGAEEEGFLKMAVIDYKMVVKLSLLSSLFGDLASISGAQAKLGDSPFTMTISRNGTMRVDMRTGIVVRDNGQMVISGGIGDKQRTIKSTITVRMLEMTRGGVTTKID